MSTPNLDSELQFKTARSGGAGGQHVNKVSTKVILHFQVADSAMLTEEQKSLIIRRLSNKINNEGYLQIACQDTRSQHRNKEICVFRFYQIIEKALQVQKKRRKKKPTRAMIEKRLRDKKHRAQIKQNRRNDPGL